MRATTSLYLTAAVVLGIIYSCSNASAAATDEPLIQQGDLVYQGAFRVPAGDHNGCNGNTGQHCFTYGGNALGYYPVNESLFFGGHDWVQTLGEVSIPSTISLSSTATVLQDLTDVTEGKLGQIGPSTNKLAGTLVYNNQLIVTGSIYYGPSGPQTVSHGISPTNLSAGDFKGFYPMDTGNAGAPPRAVSGWMTTIPSEWQPLLGGPALTGWCCMPGPQNTSNGPAATVFNPGDVGVGNSIPGTTLLYYPFPYHPIADSTTQNVYYNLATVIRGIAFPQGSRSVLFFGRHGTGPYCYGPGTGDNSKAGTIDPAVDALDPFCYDPVDASKGTHSYPYRFQVWAYDANDLLSVKNGLKESWQIMPYAVWELTGMGSTGGAKIMGATYDPATGRLFITPDYGDSPVVHVYKITVSHTVFSPAPPNNLRKR